MSKPSTTNCPKLHAAAQVELMLPRALQGRIYLKLCLLLKMKYTARRCMFKRYSGGYSTVVPPLPIPNREVKHSRADGTAHPRESRSPPFYERLRSEKNGASHFLYMRMKYVSGGGGAGIECRRYERGCRAQSRRWYCSSDTSDARE